MLLLDVVVGGVVDRCYVFLDFWSLATQEEAKVAVGRVDVATTTTKQGSRFRICPASKYIQIDVSHTFFHPPLGFGGPIRLQAFFYIRKR